MLYVGCGSAKNASENTAGKLSANQYPIQLEVNKALFLSANPNLNITSVKCTLSDGSNSECYKIVSKSTPIDHEMGPWCPENISDTAAEGGIWIENGEVYDVDGEFIKNMAAFYNDDEWQMYDKDGKIFVTKTKEDCINAANPRVGEEYKNYCVECIPSYISEVSSTYLIPKLAVITAEPTMYQMGPGGGQGRPERGTQEEGDARPQRPQSGERPLKPDGDRPPRDNRGKGGGRAPSARGLALNGVEFSAPAPTNNILSAYTLAPFDDAGGHINVHQGYHYHAATGVSYSVPQEDGHAPLIGYALDGHGIYAHLDANGKEAEGLDECRGQYDELRGYHYHADAAGSNNFINCLRGAYAELQVD